MLRRYTYTGGRDMTYRRDEDGLESAAIAPQREIWVRNTQLSEWLWRCVQILESPNLFSPEEYEAKKAEVLTEMRREIAWPYLPTSSTQPPASSPHDPLASPSDKSAT